jgi:hypothetical protein
MFRTGSMKAQEIRFMFSVGTQDPYCGPLLTPKPYPSLMVESWIGNLKMSLT